MRVPDFCMYVCVFVCGVHMGGCCCVGLGHLLLTLGVPRVVVVLSGDLRGRCMAVAVWLIIGVRDPQGVSGMFGFWMRVCVAYAAA